MDRYHPLPPQHLVIAPALSFRYSFTSFEGFLNAKLLTEIFRIRGEHPAQTPLKALIETVRGYDMGISSTVSFGPERHQGLDDVYYTTVQNGRFVPVTDWQQWQR
jgi:branched-chain amino acid transport system substrate-binding protein